MFLHYNINWHSLLTQNSPRQMHCLPLLRSLWQTMSCSCCQELTFSQEGKRNVFVNNCERFSVKQERMGLGLNAANRVGKSESAEGRTTAL